MDQGDEQLTALLANDLDRYFEQVVLAYQDRLYAFVLLREHNVHNAEEIVLLALERAYYALKNYSPQRIRVLKLDRWLYEITRNVLSNYNRASRIRSTRLPSITIHDEVEDGEALEIEDSSLMPDEEVCRREERHELARHVAALPEVYRETMHLYYFNELSYHEIAERLAQPIGTVKSNVHRGTRLLRQALQAETREVK
jgi:RNA polymerase sigma-70 factor (ECF subfamily)